MSNLYTDSTQERLTLHQIYQQGMLLRSKLAALKRGLLVPHGGTADTAEVASQS
nr:hypothetical protein [uncultured Roseateles sp.]